MRLFLFGIILIVAFLVGLCSCKEQVFPDKYNLNFSYQQPSDILTSFKWTFSYGSIGGDVTIDSTELINGKYPLSFQTQKKGLFSKALVVEFRQIFLIPEECIGEKVTIIINNKCKKIETAYLEISGVDENESPTFREILDIKSESWETKKINIPSSDSRLMNLALFFREDTTIQITQADTLFWIDKITIKIGDKDINQFPENTFYLKDSDWKLNPELIIPLSISDSCFREDSIFSFNSNRILALGETVHGCEGMDIVAYNIIKQQIQTGQCKLLLEELPVEIGMLVDLYIQGKVPEKAIETIHTILYVNMGEFDEKKRGDLYRWIRQYNEQTTEKVKFAGIDKFCCENTLFEYLRFFSTNTTKAVLVPLMEFIDNRKFHEAKEWICEKESELTHILGQENFQLFTYVFDLYIDYHLSRFYHEGSIRIFHKYQLRDSLMFERACGFIDYHLPPGKQAIISAHYGHVSRSFSNFYIPYGSTLGHYLSEKYKEDYTAIAIIAGEGSFTPNLTKINLSPPSPNSIEKAAIQTGRGCFYYPISGVPDGLSFIRSNGVNIYYGGNDDWDLVSLKKRIDGFIFIPKGEGIFFEGGREAEIMRRFLKREELYKMRKQFLENLSKD